MDAEERGELVESGSFRVDRAKALEKLSAFQLAEPGLFVNCWIRAAEASGARRIAFDFDGKELSFRFDGRPFTRRELRDPYGGIFAEEERADPRLKHFGFGILGALRLGATEIRTVSGPPEQRLRLCITGLDQDRLEALEGGADGGETALRVLWPRGEAPDAIREGLAQATAASGYGRAQLRLFGELQRREQPGGKGIALRFDHGSRHGFLELAGGAVEEIAWSHFGVRVDSAPLAGAVSGVWGFLDDDDLRLTASLAGFVQDAKFAAAREFLSGQAGRLLLKAAGLRAATLRRQAAFAPEREWMVGFGKWTHWILDRCAALLTEPERDRPDRFKRALWEVPVLSDMRTGAPVSLFDLWVNRERTGSILVSDRRLFRRADYSWDLFWVPDERAIEALSRLFGRAVRREKIA